jgi:pyruvate dehydrogenase E2 component (dihydrolipoamide acetyltransferase)
MAHLMPVPEVAAGATEVVFSEWLISPGTHVQMGQPIAVIETEKAIVEIVADADSTLLAALASAGTTVDVGSPMALFGTQEQVGQDVDALLAELGHRASTDAVPDVEETPGPANPPPPAAAPPRIFASPLARRLLAEAGLPIESVVGTGPRGRIRRRDVDAAIASRQDSESLPVGATENLRSEPAPSVSPPTGSFNSPAIDARDVPHSRLRRAVARRLMESKNEIPHFYLRRTAVLDDLIALRSKINEGRTERISVNDFLIRAIAAAHSRVADANVIWAEDALRYFAQADVAVAIASTRGLVTPVLRGVDSMSLSSISAQVREFAQAADAGRLRQDDLVGGTITISNLGMYGVDEFSAIINPPHSAILAVGAAKPTVRVHDSELVVATTVEFVLSVDHRAIDGALAAQWMAALVESVENPLSLLAV